jgi:hypothetical protein
VRSYKIFSLIELSDEGCIIAQAEWFVQKQSIVVPRKNSPRLLLAWERFVGWVGIFFQDRIDFCF